MTGLGASAESGSSRASTTPGMDMSPTASVGGTRGLGGESGGTSPDGRDNREGIANTTSAGSHANSSSGMVSARGVSADGNSGLAGREKERAGESSELAELARRLAPRIAALPIRENGRRRLFALAGPPASGKSSLSEALVAELGPRARAVPMDGFHLDNRILDAAGTRQRKGAPETFDLGGLARLLPALRAAPSVAYPVFDRDRDIAIAGAGLVDEDCDTVVLEGNYLLFDAPGWRDLVREWDGCLFLDTPIATLRERLVRRWTDLGMSDRDAVEKVDGNDLPNARAVLEARLAPDTELSESRP